MENTQHLQPPSTSSVEQPRAYILDALSRSESQLADAIAMLEKSQAERSRLIDELSVERRKVFDLEEYKIRATERLTRATEKITRLEGKIEAWGEAHQQTLERL